MRIYKIYATITATAANAASITFAKSGRIKGIRCDAYIDTVVDNEGSAWELSLFPTNLIVSNDTAGPISSWAIRNNGTSGGPNYLKSAELVDIPVGLGEKLYVNVTAAGSPTAGGANIYIDVED